MAKNPVTEDIAVTEPVISDQTIAGISSFDDALRVLSDAGVVVVPTDEALGLLAVTDKDSLVGAQNKFIILEWEFNTSDQKNDAGEYGEFVSVTYVKASGEKGVFNDGSTGVYTQLRELTDATGKRMGLFAPRGLRRSDYDHPLHGASTTFYLA